jgi:hypothetical protein
VLECVATPGQLRSLRARTAVDLAHEERQRCCNVPPGAGGAWRKGSASLAADHDRMLAMLEAWDRRVRQHAAVAPTETP